MKIIVDKMPTKAEECLFKTVIFMKEEKPRHKIAKYFLGPKFEFTWCYGCGVNGSRSICELSKEKQCNKLECLKR